jgi:hypothetical protein
MESATGSKTDLPKINKLGSKTSLKNSKTSLKSLNNISSRRGSRVKDDIKQSMLAISKKLAPVSDIDPLKAPYYTTEITGIAPLFLTSQTQSLFKVVIGSDVTVESLYRIIPKADYISDMQTRLAISDFTPFKKEILEYPGEELLLHYDPDYKYGQNFFLCITLEAAALITNPPKSVDDALIDQLVKKTVKKTLGWESLGSEKEIELENVPAAPRIVVKMSRRASEFGKPFKATDRDAIDGFIELRPYKDANYELFRAEMSRGIQAVSETTNSASQTTWNRKLNFQCQYSPILLEEEEREQILQSEKMLDFIFNVSAQFEHALQQNELLDIYSDSYIKLVDEELVADQSQSSVLQEFQSFTDLLRSKNQSISCIDWHPKIPGIVAVSCTHKLGLDERIEKGFYALPRTSLILLWSFNDPIQPQLILEAPDDVFSFKFNPVDPNLIAGGCQNGQMILWDISAYEDQLTKTRSTSDNSVDGNKERSIVRVKYEIVSSIEASARNCIRDIYWLPQNFELAHNGEWLENSEYGHKQLIAASLDGTVTFWDVRFKKDLKSLDLVWRPFLRIPLTTLDNSSEYSLTKVSIDCTSILAGSKRNTKFFCATEEGDLIYSDWNKEKSSEESSIII